MHLWHLKCIFETGGATLGQLNVAFCLRWPELKPITGGGLVAIVPTRLELF